MSWFRLCYISSAFINKIRLRLKHGFKGYKDATWSFNITVFYACNTTSKTYICFSFDLEPVFRQFNQPIRFLDK